MKKPLNVHIEFIDFRSDPNSKWPLQLVNTKTAVILSVLQMVWW